MADFCNICAQDFGFSTDILKKYESNKWLTKEEYFGLEAYKIKIEE